MDLPLSRPSRRVRTWIRAWIRAWQPAFPPLPPELAGEVTAQDPDWLVRELAVAASPPWRFWRFLTGRCWWVASVFGRVRVTGGLPADLQGGPVLIASNHIGDYDNVVLAAVLGRAGLAPRFLATGGIMRAAVFGPALERAGGIRVDRGTEVAAHAVRVTRVALANGGHVVTFPEGRVGLTADGWPERGRTGLARLALEVAVPVVPVSLWGSHEVLAYANDRAKLRTALRALYRRPLLQVHIGPPVALADLRAGRVGDAHRARIRIIAAITRGLVPLRAQEPDRPAFHDPTRPIGAVAAFPGGHVPAEVP